jgi:hypothetical protein
MLIAKALSEHLRRLLYIVSIPFKDIALCVNVLQIFAKDLSNNAIKLEK